MTSPKFNPKSMLVTGGAGFIGLNFVKHVLGKNDGTQIINLDKLTYAANSEELPALQNTANYVFIEGDICDDVLVEDVLGRYRVDCIVNFAAESHVDRSIDGPVEFAKNNVLGTARLLEQARAHWNKTFDRDQRSFRFHQVSTDEVYGSLDRDDAPFTEEHCYKPNSPYSASKAGADHIVRSYFETFGLPVTTTCCSNNYGPLQNQEKLIPVIIKSCLAGTPIPIYGDGSNIRDWLYVRDHCSAIETVIEKGEIGETYNVGADNEISNLELTKMICQALDEIYPRTSSDTYENLISFVDDRLGHDWRYAIDSKKITQELNWAPSFEFETGLHNTLTHYVTKLGYRFPETSG